MKELQRSSPPWNSLPSSKNTLVESIIAVLRSSLGKFWPISALILIAIVLAPVFVFMDSIEFEPALFVTEWLKICIEGLIFFFVLEIVRHKSMSFTTQQLLQNFIAMNFVVPIAELITSLEDFRLAIENPSPEEIESNIVAALRNWGVVENALSNEAISHFSANEATAVWLQKKRDLLEPKLCESILNSLTAVSTPESFPEEEFNDLVMRLNSFMTSIKSMQGNNISKNFYENS